MASRKCFDLTSKVGFSLLVILFLIYLLLQFHFYPLAEQKLIVCEELLDDNLPDSGDCFGTELALVNIAIFFTILGMGFILIIFILFRFFRLLRRKGCGFRKKKKEK